jgi:hypothetical protein
MRVSDPHLNNVVFLGWLEPDQSGGVERPHWVGTACLVSVPCAGIGFWPYVVTVKHVADQLGGKKWCIRTNTMDGKSKIAQGGVSARWWKHPTEEDAVDVAVMPWSPPEGAVFAHISVEMFATDQVIRDKNIGVGDEVFCIGLFTLHTGEERNLPIVRTGNVAMMPGEKLPRAKIGNYLGPIDAYLIEVRSMGGLSGSPVYVRETLQIDYPSVDKTTGESKTLKIAAPGRYYLLGLMHGHWNIHPSEHNRYDFETTTRVSESIALGVSVVVPATKILEVLNQPGLVAHRDEIDWEAEMRRRATYSD